MKYLSVCSGIEAATVAWHPLGWEPVAFSEIDRFPSAVLAHHYPQTPNLGDMTLYKEWNIEPVDILVGGTPCQSFSVAGLRRGLDDPRGNLMLVYLGLLDRFRPRWMVWENVPGVLSSNRGRDFGTFLAGLAELGYGFAYRVLDAQYFGVPQRRRRVFVVGYFGDWRPPAAVLFESESLRGNPPPSREAGQGSAPNAGGRAAQCYENHAQDSRVREIDLPTIHAKAGTGGGNLPLVMAHGHANAEIVRDGLPSLTCNHEAPIVAHAIQAGATRENPKSGPDGIGVQADVAYTLEARSEVQIVAHTLRGRGFDASEDGTGRGTPLVTVAFPANLSATQHASAENMSPCLGAKNPTAVAFAENSRAELRLEGGDGSRVGALSAGGGKPGQGAPMIAQLSAVRRLTPRECERLQGFPDDYTAIPWRGKDAMDCPDGPRYKALGNSMAVPVMRWIGERIQMVEGTKGNPHG